MNYISQINAFWERLEIEQNLKPSSIVVYLSLLQINNKNGWKPKFRAVFGQVLNMTGISNAKTYYAALDELTTHAYIIWEKGPNQYQAALFSLPTLYQKMEEHGKSNVNALEEHMVEHGKSRGNIPKQLNNKPKNNKTFIPPTLEDIILFAKEKGYSYDLARKAFEHYDTGNWQDSTGKQVINWRQKILTNWFNKESKSGNQIDYLLPAEIAQQKKDAKKVSNGEIK